MALRPLLDSLPPLHQLAQHRKCLQDLQPAIPGPVVFLETLLGIHFLLLQKAQRCIFARSIHLHIHSFDPSGSDSCSGSGVSTATPGRRRYVD